MSTRSLGVTTLAVLSLYGCADRFRAVTPSPGAGTMAVADEGAGPLTVAPLPPDLSWLSEGLRLYRSLETGVGGQSSQLQLQSAGAEMSSLALAPTAGLLPGTLPAAPGGTDLRFVALPVLGEAAGELAAVPAEVAAARGLLPSALASARSGGRMVALPVAARWIALAWDPARLEEGPTLVPPHLEDWIEQLRSLRRSRPEQPPLIVAWGEADIAGSFALLLAAHGGRLLDDAGRPAFTGPEGEATLQQMIRMRDEGLVQPTALETTSKRLAESLTGPYAYWLCPSDALIGAGGSQERWVRLSMLRLSGLPRAREQYHYPEAATVSLVQYQGLAVTGDSRRAAAAWRLAGFLTDPVVLRSAPAVTSILRAPAVVDNPLVRQARALMAHNQVPWPNPQGLDEALGRFLHAALRKLLTPREALDRAALQFQQPGALPSAQETPAGVPQPAEGPTSTQGAAAAPGSTASQGGGAAPGAYPATHPPTDSPEPPPGTSSWRDETGLGQGRPGSTRVPVAPAPRPGLPATPGAAH
jgi:ABC-type glycerol-3-phosphate transport system substrate-binding protein